MSICDCDGAGCDCYCGGDGRSRGGGGLKSLEAVDVWEKRSRCKLVASSHSMYSSSDCYMRRPSKPIRSPIRPSVSPSVRQSVFIPAPSCIDQARLPASSFPSHSYPSHSFVSFYLYMSYSSSFLSSFFFISSFFFPLLFVLTVRLLYSHSSPTLPLLLIVLLPILVLLPLLFLSLIPSSTYPPPLSWSSFLSSSIFLSLSLSSSSWFLLLTNPGHRSVQCLFMMRKDASSVSHRKQSLKMREDETNELIDGRKERKSTKHRWMRKDIALDANERCGARSHWKRCTRTIPNTFRRIHAYSLSLCCTHGSHSSSYCAKHVIS